MVQHADRQTHAKARHSLITAAFMDVPISLGLHSSASCSSSISRDPYRPAATADVFGSTSST
jgi:hypothetical protein